MGDLLLQDLDSPQTADMMQSNSSEHFYVNTTALNSAAQDEETNVSLAEKNADYFHEMFKPHIDTIQVEDRFTTGITPFHSALAQGNKDFINEVLQKLDQSLQEKVVDCLVDYTKPIVLQKDVLASKLNDFPQRHRETIKAHYTTVQVCKHPFKDLEFHLPLSIAATSGEYDMIQLLLDYKANIFNTDDKGNNIIHDLAIFSQNHNELALKIYNKLVKGIQSSSDKQRLIMAKNKKGYKPLDIAMEKISVDFAKTLLNTDEVYRFAVKDFGIFQHVLYDVSEYEAKNTDKLHIFHYLATIAEVDLAKLDNCNFMNTEPIKTWTSAKVDSHRIQTAAWGITWVIFLTLYFVSVGMYFLRSGERPPLALSITLLINAVFLVMSEISNAITERHVYRIIYNNSNKGFPIAFSPAYRVFHLLFALSLTITESLHIAMVPCEDNKELFVTLYVLNAVFGLSSLLLFTQLNQHTGHLLIIIDRMMWDVILFISVAGIIFFAFALAFYLLHAPPMCADPNNTLNWNATKDMFASFASTVYETQLLALGIMAPKNLYFEDAQIPTLAMVLYVIFLIMLCIVLLNLLIAIMSDRVSELSNHKQSIMQIQALSFAMFLEGKMRLAEQLYCSKCNLFRSAHKRALEKYFVTNDDQTQVFLHVLEKIPQMINCNSKDLTSVETIANIKMFFQHKRKNNNVNPSQ